MWERWFNWLWTWNSFRSLTGWSGYFRNFWSAGIFHTTIYRVDKFTTKLGATLKEQHIHFWTIAAEDYTRCYSSQLRTEATVHRGSQKEDWKIVTWSDEVWFLLYCSDGTVRIRCKQRERNYSVLYLQVKLVVMRCAGIMFLAHFEPNTNWA